MTLVTPDYIPRARLNSVDREAGNPPGTAMQPATNTVEPGGNAVANAKTVTVDIAPTDDPIIFLTKLMNDPSADYKSRMRAAVTAAQYLKTRTKDGGKKDRLQEEAEAAVGVSKFKPMAPPRLTAVK